jgi:hypothetical protein
VPGRNRHRDTEFFNRICTTRTSEAGSEASSNQRQLANCGLHAFRRLPTPTDCFNSCSILPALDVEPQFRTKSAKFDLGYMTCPAILQAAVTKAC